MVRRGPAAAVATGVVVVLAGLAGAALMLLHAPAGDVWADNSFTGCVVAVGYGLTGAYVAAARPRNLVGWVLLWIAAAQAASGFGSGWAQHGTYGATAAAWVSSWAWFPGFAALPTFLLVLYPIGRASGRRRSLLVVAAAGIALLTSALAVSPKALSDIAPVQHPFPLPAVEVPLAVAGAMLLLPCVLLCLVDALRRLWRAQSPEREQLAWLLTAVVLAVGTSYLPLGRVNLVLHALLPVAIGIGVVRHRLLDLQVVVRRTLLFLALTAVVVLVFVAVTAAVSEVVDEGPLPVAVAAALVAVGLTPVRERLQRAVDRLVYGERRDPVRALAELARDVEQHDDATLVPQVLATVASALRTPYVALLDPSGERVAHAGAPAEGSPLRLPLQVGGTDVGTLLVAPRTPRDGWSREDIALLDVLAPQVAVVVRSARLYEEVAASRDLVLAATADERLRLRQELHDGLGPALSGIALGLEAAEASLGAAPQRAQVLLARLREETQVAATEVRRLVEGLRPAALEGRALDDALSDLLDGVAASGRLQVERRLQRPLPPLRPDVDAAAFRIVSESVTNVVRHSGARRCLVDVRVERDALRLVVEDDGSGLPAQPRDGVGLVSMRRRARELGGTWTAEPRQGGGTRVCVVLPVRAGVPA